MGAEKAVLIVLLSVSVVINIGLGLFLFFRHKKNRRPVAEYKKVENPDVEQFAAPRKPQVARNRSAESADKDDKADKPSEIKEELKINALRSGENELRSELRGAPEEQQRSDRQKLQEPVGRNEFVKCMQQVVEFINDYHDESHKYPVIPENDISTLKLQKDAPSRPEECVDIMKDLKEVVIPNICHTQHPRYHAKFSGKSLADIVGNTISSAIGYDVNCSPVIETIETILCKWLRTALAIPQMKRENRLQDPIGAVFYTLRDVYVAIIRHCIEKYESRHDSEKSDEEKRRKRKDFVVYCSDDGQLALEEACSVVKVKLRRVNTFDRDSCGMTANNLEKQVDKDLQRALCPLVIIANYGSTNVAANDEVWDLVHLAKSRKIWLHLDATYAGCEWLDENRRNNVHSLLADCNSAHVAFSSLFPYSGRVNIVWSGERLELASAKIHYGEHPIRLWILIRLYGMRSIREAVKRKITLGNAFSDRISHHPEFFEMHHANDHGVTMFQYNNKNMKNSSKDVNKMTSMFHNYLVQSSILKFALFRFHGKVLIKAVVNCERCNLSMMEESISTLLNSVEEFEEALKKKKSKLVETPKLDYCEIIGGSPNETTEDTQSEEKL